MARELVFEYDLADQLTEASDPAATYTFTLDNLGRVTSETQDLAGLTPDIVLASTWDVMSNRTSLAATIGGTADFKNDYVYDFLNRMTRVTQQDVGGGNVVADKRVDFAYNGLGQFTTIDRYQNTGGSNIVAQTTFAYDDDNRLTDLDHKQSSTTLAGYDYGYDNMGRIASIDSFIEDVSTFTYDKTSQLTAADHTSPRADESYTYDDNGNRIGGSYDTDPNNLTVSDGTYNYEYDDEGNRTKRTKISDGSYEEYTWDHRNRLTKITFKNSSHTVLKTVDQTYDVYNRWVRRQTDPDGLGGSSAVDTFFAGYDGIHPTLQFDGAAASDLTNRNLFGPAVDQILAVENVTALNAAGNVLHPLSDHLGTPRDIADQNESTNITSVTNHRTYDSFGTQTVETNSAVDLFFGFTGKPLDSDTGFQNNLHRLYDSALAQWLSEDPIGFAAGDGNVRRYVSNSPFLQTDPLGLDGNGCLWWYLWNGWGWNRPTPPPAAPLANPHFTVRQQVMDTRVIYSGGTSGVIQRTNPLIAADNEEARRRYEQAMLDWYRRIMREMLAVGDALEQGGPTELARIRPEYNDYMSSMRYQGGHLYAGPSGPNGIPFPPWQSLSLTIHDTYDVYYRMGWLRFGGNVSLVRAGNLDHFVQNGSSYNLPLLPGIAVSEEAFFGANEQRAIGELLHEGAHDRWGPGHGQHFSGLVPAGETWRHHGDQVSQYIAFLRSSRDNQGNTLWATVVNSAGVRPTLRGTTEPHPQSATTGQLIGP